MKTRGIIYLLAFALIAYFLYSGSQNNEPIVAPQSINRQAILADFADLSDNDIPEASQGGTFVTSEIFFPADFNGDGGDEFYVTMEDGHTLYTQRYIIEKAQTEPDETVRLVYRLKANWENFRPPVGKYESHKFDGEKWTEIVLDN